MIGIISLMIGLSSLIIILSLKVFVLLGVGLAKLSGKKIANKEIKETNEKIQKQLNEMLIQNNYVERHNKELAQQSIKQCANHETEENEKKEKLIKTIKMLQAKYPFAEEELFVKLSEIYFINEDINKVIQEMEKSNTEKINNMINN